MTKVKLILKNNNNNKKKILENYFTKLIEKNIYTKSNL